MANHKHSLHATTPTTVAAKILLSRNLKRTWRRLRLAAKSSQKDIEHVHRLRISTRRSLAALEVFREFLPARRAERVARQLNQLRQVAAKARDYDVMIQKRKSDESSDRKLLKRLKKSRKKAQKPIVEVYDGLREQKLYRRECRKLVTSLDRFDSSVQPPFSVWASRKLAIMLVVFFSQSPGKVRDLKQLHRFRIAAKKFRYTLEVLRPAFQSNAYELVMPDFRRLQDLLGHINDHAVALDRIRMIDRKGFKVDEGISQREMQELESSVQEFVDWWTPETAFDMRQKLESLVIHQQLLAPNVSD